MTNTQPEQTKKRNIIEITRRYHPILGYDLRVNDESGSRKLTLEPVSFPKAIEVIVAIPSTVYRRDSFIDIKTEDIRGEERDGFLAVIRKLESMAKETAMYKHQRDRAESF